MATGFFNRTAGQIRSNTLLRKSFLTAGVLFGAICLIGFFTKLIIDQTGAISKALSDSRFNTSFFSVSTEEAHRIKLVFGIGAGMILVSSVMTLI